LLKIIYTGSLRFLVTLLTPGITEKKVPPRHQSRYIGSTWDIVYRKLKVVEAPITFAIGS
jgi:hypothetical protein